MYPTVSVPEKALRLKTWKYIIVARSTNAYIQPILFQLSNLSSCTAKSHTAGNGRSAARAAQAMFLRGQLGDPSP